METNYVSRTQYGMYAGKEGHGSGPGIVGTITLVGNDVYAVLSFGGFLGMGDKLFARSLERAGA